MDQAREGGESMTRMIWLSWILMLATTVGVYGADAGLQAGSLEWDGQSRSFQVYLPQAAVDEPQRVRPLLLVLHGGGGSGLGIRGVTKRRFEVIAEAGDILVVYPDAIGGVWNDDRHDLATRPDADGVDDVGFLAALADHCAATWNADADRVFVTGLSNGGMMCYRVARELADRVAGFAPVDACLPSQAVPYQLPRPIPMLLSVGTADPLMPFDGGFVGADTDPNNTVIAAMATADAVAAENGLPGTISVSQLPDLVDDGTVVERVVYAGGAVGTAVRVDRVIDGGHQWPGGLEYLPESQIGLLCEDYLACDAIWAFFHTSGRVDPPERRIRIRVERESATVIESAPVAPYAVDDGTEAFFDQLDPTEVTVFRFTAEASS